MNDRLVVHCDGGARGNPGPAGIGAVVTDPSTSPPEVVATVSESIGTATNNVAEYRALIAGVDAARRLGAREVEVRADSKLVVEQLAGRWRVKQAHLRPLHAQALELLGAFDRFELRHVPREENVDADALANAAMDAAAAR